jgi:hypothetical protein
MAWWGVIYLLVASEKRMQPSCMAAVGRVPGTYPASSHPFAFQDTNITLSQCKKMLDEGACIRHPSWRFSTILILTAGRSCFELEVEVGERS